MSARRKGPDPAKFRTPRNPQTLNRKLKDCENIVPA
jgi:hypothetical protein